MCIVMSLSMKHINSLFEERIRIIGDISNGSFTAADSRKGRIIIETFSQPTSSCYNSKRNNEAFDSDFFHHRSVLAGCSCFG